MSQFAVGIDLGTTNCALAYTNLDAEPAVVLSEIPQLTGPNEITPATLLPSFLYIPGERDFPPNSTALPWDSAPPYVTGKLAQRRGAEIPSRLVSSAKSWLSYAAVDRSAAILPLHASEGIAKISPVDASAAYLTHLKDAWNFAHPDQPLEDQQVLITVPASFDAVARELTERAAAQAGLRNVAMLEEPQAAFYAWLERHPEWRQLVNKGDLILVVDIGGGTTDFTLIAVTEHDGQLALERVAVGEHILLGGDNIDLALAHQMAADLAARNVKIDASQLQALWSNCRLAKERLLSPEHAGEDAATVTILGKGSSLIGGTVKATLTRAVLEQTLASFFPVVDANDHPQRTKRAALQELGLPYAQDAAVTRHLAKFLNGAAPTHVLFNGGVLHAPFVRNRILEVLNLWRQGSPIKHLTGEDLMHSVAKGAAYYGAVRQGRGVRIRGGIAQSYYVGIESAMPAVPGMLAPLKALAVAQFGTEEGTTTTVPNREFGLVVDEPAEFRFFCSNTRKNDAPGTLIEEVTDEFQELSPVEVLLPAESNTPAVIPVNFETVITETGMLQLWCVARDGRRWKLEYNTRN